MAKFNWQQLQQPGMQYRPMVRWWWTGLDVTQEELCRELDDMVEGGFAGGEVQAFTRNDAKFDPSNKELAKRVHRYGTPYYFDLIRDLMAQAKERGLILDITAGSGWPMGDTNITPETGMQALIVGSTSVQGGKGRQRVELPKAASAVDALLGAEKTSFANINGRMIQVMDYPQMKTNLKLLRVTIGRANGPVGEYELHPQQPMMIDADSLEDVTGCVFDGQLEYDFGPGDWYVFAAYHGPSYQLVKSDSKQFPEKQSYVVNHFASGLIEHYMQRHVGQGRWDEFSPDTFRAFFADSFELIGPYFWTDSFLTEFRNRKGYELSPYLPILMITPGELTEDGTSKASFELEANIADRVRYDYESVLADIFTEYFLEQMTQWAHEHNVKARVQCYGHVMDNIRAFGRVDIPETEQLACSGLIDFMKTAGSAAHLYGKPLVTAESTVWPLRDYMETPLKFKTASDRLSISGVGQLIYHGMPYLNERYDYPGFFPWFDAHGTFIARTSPMWPWMKQVNLAIARNQLVVQEGQAVIDVCVYTDNLSYEISGNEIVEDLSYGELDGIDRKPEVPGMGRRWSLDRWDYLARQSRAVNMRLMEAGYDYCHINREMLCGAELKDGVLQAGKARFKAIVVPPCAWMELESAKALRKLADAGFPVIFVGRVPAQVPGFKDYQALEAQLNQALAPMSAIDAAALIETLQAADVYGGVCFGGAQGMQHIHRSFDDAQVYLIRSSVFEPRMVQVTFPIQKQHVCAVDPWTGKLAQVAPRVENGKTVLDLPFVSYGSQMIIFTDSALPACDSDLLRVMEKSIGAPAAMDLSTGWKLTVNSFFGQDPIVLENVSAMDWADMPELSGISGEGLYEKRFTLDSAAPQDAVLDFTLIGDIAQVTVNGTAVDDLLSLPYACRVGHLLREGENVITVKVTTTLRNGLIGINKFKKQRQHAMAGMVGPVSLKY